MSSVRSFLHLSECLFPSTVERVCIELGRKGLHLPLFRLPSYFSLAERFSITSNTGGKEVFFARLFKILSQDEFECDLRKDDATVLVKKGRFWKQNSSNTVSSLSGENTDPNALSSSRSLIVAQQTPTSSFIRSLMRQEVGRFCFGMLISARL